MQQGSIRFREWLPGRASLGDAMGDQGRAGKQDDGHERKHKASAAWLVKSLGRSV